MVEALPTTLLDLLSNDLVLRQTAPYIPLPSLLALSSSNKTFRELLFSKPDPWRYLDLRGIRSAIIDSSPIDVGGISWRAERMDESLTEDDFYAGPIRGIFSKLQSKHVLKHVQTLVLDGLSVPADLVRDIVAEDRYNVKILSVREAKNLNHTKLQQVLRYIVRPTRSEESPRLKALYVFGRKDAPRTLTSQPKRAALQAPSGVLASEGAQIGAQWNHRSTTMLNAAIPEDDQEKWYGCNGRIVALPQRDWAETLHACEGLIAFDAMLCRGPRHDITKVESTDYYPPRFATVALGPKGCEICGSCPEGAAVFGQSSESALPLLAPPPSHVATVRAAQRPDTNDSVFSRLIMRCEDCLRGRWCERCNRWWCEDCYCEPVSRVSVTEGAASQKLDPSSWPGPTPKDDDSTATSNGPPIKVYIATALAADERAKIARPSTSDVAVLATVNTAWSTTKAPPSQSAIGVAIADAGLESCTDLELRVRSCYHALLMVQSSHAQPKSSPVNMLTRTIPLVPPAP